MRKATAVLAASLVLLTAACSRNVGVASDPAPAAATTPAAASAFDPSGMYDFVAQFGGQSHSGTLEIERAPTTGFRGEAWLEGESDPAIIHSGSVTDRHVVLNGTVGGNDVVFELDFDGAGFSGVIIAGGDTVPVTGTRRTT